MSVLGQKRNMMGRLQNPYVAGAGPLKHPPTVKSTPMCRAGTGRGGNVLRGNDLLKYWGETIYQAHNGIFYSQVGEYSVWCCVRDLADEVEAQASEIEELREQIEELQEDEDVVQEEGT